jgi:hypothetical protein
MTAVAFPPDVSPVAKPGVVDRNLRQSCAVRLIDRRTGLTHRINGSPLLVFTRNPAEAVAELLSGRDSSVWEARVEPIGGEA